MSSTIKKADQNTIEVMLLMTEACNLNCRYCYECNKSHNKMSFETAKHIIDKEFEKAKGSDTNIVVQFFGGEPLLEFETVKKIYEYIHSYNSPNYNYCFAVTNGTLLDENMKEWMYEHKNDFICGLSLDGTPDVHNYNRSNSYDMIDLDFFVKTWPNQKVKMTISPDMLGKLSDCVIHCHELGFGVLCNLADGEDWKPESSNILKDELTKLVEFYINNPDFDVCSILKMPLLHVGIKEREYIPQWCGCGKNIHAYDCSGKLYPCQMFMDITRKNVHIPVTKKEYPLNTLPEKCQKCPLVGCCPTCIGVNVLRGCSNFYHTDVECTNIKIQFLATSFLMYDKYKKGLLKFSETEEYVLLNSIKTIQLAFSDMKI